MNSDNDVEDDDNEESDESMCENVNLHRNTVIPSLMDDQFMDVAFRSREVEESYYQSNNRRFNQNGLHSTTYF